MVTVTPQGLKIGVVSKHSHPQSKELTETLLRWLTQRQISFLVEEKTAHKVGLYLNPDRIVQLNELSFYCSILVILGGDGTLISACHHPSSSPLTIIGVNLGTLGFLTEITIDELFPVLESTIAGTCSLQERKLLLAEVHRAQATHTYYALNDVVISKQALARIFSLEVTIDGHSAARTRGDGVIISTPSGSTAYSMAAGGSIVHPQVNALIMTPICPHSLTLRPIVLPADSVIGLRILPTSRKEKVYLTIDGQEGSTLSAGEEVLIKTSPHTVFFAKSPSKSYYEILGTKLKWGSA